jgi:hypothetical protein
MKLMLLNLVLLLLVRDDGRYASSPLKPWFESLRNGWGQSCCDLADGIGPYSNDTARHQSSQSHLLPGSATQVVGKPQP